MTTEAGWFDARAAQLAGTAFLLVGAVLCIIDIRTQRLPDRIVLPTLWTGLLLNTFGLFTAPADAVLGAAAGYLLLRVPSLAYGLRHAGRAGFGGGDVKLSAAVGAWFGVQGVLVALLVAFLAGTCAVLPGLLLGRRELSQRVPFGPAILLGAATVLVAGPDSVLRLLLGTRWLGGIG